MIKNVNKLVYTTYVHIKYMLHSYIELKYTHTMAHTVAHRIALLQ